MKSDYYKNTYCCICGQKTGSGYKCQTGFKCVQCANRTEPDLIKNFQNKLNVNQMRIDNQLDFEEREQYAYENQN